MNDLINEVTPLTRGIIWLSHEVDVKNPHYKEIDYLLDGLLTANLALEGNFSSRVIMSQNFTHPLYVMVVHELKTNELESYLSLFKDMVTENDILVIDEVNGFEKLRHQLGKLSNHLRLIQ